jgi:hypothetical protein
MILWSRRSSIWLARRSQAGEVTLDVEDPPMQLTPCIPCQTCVWSRVEK